MAYAGCPKKGCPPPPQNYAPPPQRPAREQRPLESYSPAMQERQNQVQQNSPQQNRTIFGSSYDRRTRQITTPSNQTNSSHLSPPLSGSTQSTMRVPGQGVGPSYPPKTYRLNPSTTAISDARGISIEHRNADGSHLLANWHTLPNGQRELEAYKLTNDKRAGTQTRAYLDGRRIVSGKGFITESAPGRIAVTSYASGLKTAALPNGKPVFVDRFQNIQDKSGNSRQAIVRTVYYRVHDGKAMALRTPITETYIPVSYNGGTVYAYSPWAAPDGYYDPFFNKLSVALTLTSVCPDCDSGDVEISRGWFSSSTDEDDDPSGLMADAQISSGFQDGMNGDAEDVGTDDGQVDPNAPETDLSSATQDSQTVALQNQVDDLQNQVNSAESQNSDLRSQLATQESENSELESKADTSAPAQTPTKKIAVPSDVREQMKKQVKAALALQKTQQSLSMADVVASAKAEKQLFQANKSLKVNRQSGGSCGLSTGDLLKFDQIPSDTDKTVSMKVVVSKPGNCAQNDIVQIEISDAQDMLNGFMQRLEANTKHAHDAIVQAEQKSPQKGSSG